jgi:hypothetical protein
LQEEGNLRAIELEALYDKLNPSSLDQVFFEASVSNKAPKRQ